jgi:hypothetical protein
MFESILIDFFFSKCSFWFSLVFDFLRLSQFYQSNSFNSQTMKTTMSDFKSIIAQTKIMRRSIIENSNKWNFAKSNENEMHWTNQKKTKSKTQANRARRAFRETQETKQKKQSRRAREKTRKKKQRRQIRRARKKTQKQTSQTQRNS